MFRFNPRSRCNSSRCCYRARVHVDPAWSRRITHGGDSHPEMSSSPGSVGLARAHPLTETLAMEPSRQTWSSYGPPCPLGRWSLTSDSPRMLLVLVREFESRRVARVWIYLQKYNDQLLRSPSVGKHNSTRVDEGRKSWYLLAIKMQGTNRSG